MKLISELMELNESTSNIEDRVKVAFDISVDDKHYTILKPKDKMDFPYRIREVGDTFILDQAFSPRTHITPKFNRVGVFNSRELALARIVKQYNKSTENLTTRKAI